MATTQKDFPVTNIPCAPKLPMAIIAVTSMLVTLAIGASAQTVPSKFPMAIMCWAESDHSWRVGYLFKINKNGDAMYLSANGQLAATVDASGTVVAPANRPAGLDCYGKTLDELRSSGRTMEFQRTK